LDGWRAITLLNVQVLTNVLANQIKNTFSRIFQPEQANFIKEQFILDNLIIAWKFLNGQGKLDKRCSFFKVDFNKAYDGIGSQLILDMLTWLAFGTRECFY
jgi:hypothetical protein